MEAFAHVAKGPVRRYELPKLRALNFVIERALGGGVTRSLAQDAHGKSLSSLMLSIELPGQATAARCHLPRSTKHEPRRRLPGRLGTRGDRRRPPRRLAQSGLRSRRPTTSPSRWVLRRARSSSCPAGPPVTAPMLERANKLRT
jgi:hypothetical protein